MSKYVWVVKRQSDFTEGRGPMVFDSVWVDDKAAVAEYIDDQPGVQGIRKKWSELPYGCWTMERVPVYESSVERHEEEQKKLRASALGKLSQEERDAWGLTKNLNSL